ncbi:hypothetical protein HHK36_025783 [Tetracentron sinense]|uniref:ethanolamine kinase n=1 Tax=Tetracentron sinense TaxID=13715 RepID=A0A835D3G2_TETSI|nr:hypothetical protein HHK36_025783 [Tetracentron sinense]
MEIAEEARANCNSDIPSSSLTVETSLPLPQMKPRIIYLCKDLFKKWSHLDDSHFSVETVAGGITNLLLKVSTREDNGNDVSVTVRLYGPNTEYVINRQRELQAIGYLSTAGFGAKLLGVFGNGMVQSFINARTLSPSDMKKPKLAAEIARQLHKFHQVDIPGSKEPQLWIDIIKFYEKASILEFDDSEKQRKYMTISFEEVHNEIVELKDLTDLLNAPVVFAHNDLLSGNLMLNDDEGKLYFIDFEYGSYSYRGFDIGNHFNEYAGYDCDYSVYPDKDEQYHFFRHYLQPEKPQEVSGNDLEDLYIETNTFMLASHLFWALWALLQAKTSPIDFDYLGYFFLRYEEYRKQKEVCFSLAKLYLTGSRTGCPELKFLSWDELPSAFDAEIPKLVRKWRKLEHLSFGEIPNSFTIILEEIEQWCRNFSGLKMFATIGPEEANAIVTHVPKIRSLDLCTTFVSSNEVMVILGGCKELEELKSWVLLQDSWEQCWPYRFPFPAEESWPSWTYRRRVMAALETLFVTPLPV